MFVTGLNTCSLFIHSKKNLHQLILYITQNNFFIKFINYELWSLLWVMVLFPLSYGPLYLACLLFPGLCLNRWLSCLLVGFEVLGDIGRRLFGVLLSSLLCGTYGKNGTTKIFEEEEHSIIELKCIFLLSLFNWMTALRGLAIPSYWIF